MTAVAPQSYQLSPFVGDLAHEVHLAVSELTGLSAEALGPVRREGEDLVLPLRPHGHLTLRNVGPTSRTSGADLAVRANALSGPDRLLLTRTLEEGDREARAASMRRLAKAIDSWWPFADLADEEFRKVSSSPDGAYGTLRLGYRCNQDCWFCWQDRHGPMPPIEKYGDWLDELAMLGVGSINFTGGEVTTVPGLLPLMERASRHHGLAVSIQTNAVRLGQPRYLQNLLDAGLQAVMVSLHSADPAVSDAMTRAPGTHARTLAGIRAALQSGIAVTLTCVVEAANVDGLPNHAAMIVDALNPTNPTNPIRRVTYAHPTDYFDAGRWAAQQVPFDQLRSNLSTAVSRLQRAGIPVQVGGPCGFPLCTLDPALVQQVYDVVTRDGYHPGELMHRRYGAACSTCEARTSCFGLRQEYLDRFGERGLLPIRVGLSR